MMLRLSKVLGRHGNTGEMDDQAAFQRSPLVEQTDETVSWLLAETAERFSSQQKALEGHHHAGDSLADLAVNIYESDRLRHISWENCVSCEHEILASSKKDAALTFDCNGNLKLSKRDHISPCEVSSELQIKYCLIRGISA